MNNASRRSEENSQSLLQKFQVNTMEKMEKVMQKTNETILQSVGVQLQGRNTTLEKAKKIARTRTTE